jgi:hypothetical protein
MEIVLDVELCVHNLYPILQMYTHAHEVEQMMKGDRDPRQRLGFTARD